MPALALLLACLQPNCCLHAQLLPAPNCALDEHNACSTPGVGLTARFLHPPTPHAGRNGEVLDVVHSHKLSALMGAVCSGHDKSLWLEGCAPVPGDDVIHVMPKKLDPAAEVRAPLLSALNRLYWLSQWCDSCGAQEAGPHDRGALSLLSALCALYLLYWLSLAMV